MNKSINKQETICWNCKRATSPDECPCPWADNGTPVQGWEAEKGYTFLLHVEGAEKKVPSQAYIVLSCPLYIQDKKYLDLKDVIDALAAYFQCKRNVISTYFEKKIKQYEQETGEILPVWVKYYLQDKKEKTKRRQQNT